MTNSLWCVVSHQDEHVMGTFESIESAERWIAGYIADCGANCGDVGDYEILAFHYTCYLDEEAEDDVD